MNNILHFFYRFVLIFVAILLQWQCACASSNFLTFYSAQQDNPLQMVNHYLNNGQFNKAEALLEQLEVKNYQQQLEKQVLGAKLAFLLQQPKTTIELLSKISKVEDLDLNYQIEFHELLAKSYQAEQQIIQAAQQRIKLDILLQDDSALQRNRQQMWALMQALPPEELSIQLMEAKAGSIWRGWLDFAQMMHHQNMEEDLSRWEQAYPQHPALSMITKPRSWTSFFTRPKPQVLQIRNIALLLPLSGPFAGPGTAIKDGFMNAYAQGQQQFRVKCYDSAKGAVIQYQHALEDGADLVIGPLTKADASAVAARFNRTPTLLLNDFGFSLSSTKYAFGYAPKDEAQQLAEVLHERGHHRILMVVPDNFWGQEIATSFESAALHQGLEIVSQVRYSTPKTLAFSLKQALHYHEHQTKTAQGRKTVEVTRRRDIDAIFMLAYPSMARQIMPMLKYYYAGDIPVYATSTAYAAHYQPNLDKDLDGMYFLDIPWVFSHQIGEGHWPESWNTYSRLYALGYDAYGLSQAWPMLTAMPESGFATQTGLLFLQSNGHIRRHLVLGQIRQGVAREVSGS